MSEADYIANYYGTCDMGAACIHLKPENPWIGNRCWHWTPVKDRSFKDMLVRLQLR